MVDRIALNRIGSEPALQRVGTAIVTGGRGLRGRPGSGGAAEGYEHIQSSPSAEWIINHNLGLRPTVTVFSVGGVELEPEIINPTLNQCRVLFAIPFAGSARCI